MGKILVCGTVIEEAYFFQIILWVPPNQGCHSPPGWWIIKVLGDPASQPKKPSFATSYTMHAGAGSFCIPKYNVVLPKLLGMSRNDFWMGVPVCGFQRTKSSCGFSSKPSLIGSMGLVCLLTFGEFFRGECSWIYQSHRILPGHSLPEGVLPTVVFHPTLQVTKMVRNPHL